MSRPRGIHAVLENLPRLTQRIPKLVEKENMQIDEVVEKVDAGIDVKTCI